MNRFSMGIGDRFGRQGAAQLQAFVTAREKGVEVTPVWNKSHREHTIIGTVPGDVRVEADAAVSALGWSGPYCVDADHVGLKSVDLFIEASDFFTLDVADAIGGEIDMDMEREIAGFVERHAGYLGELVIPGIAEPLSITRDMIAGIARKYLPAIHEARRIYDRVSSSREGTFVTEVSMDETDDPQTPVEMLFILAAIAEAGIPADTIAPKFSGRFNKGVDYVGDVSAFAREFEDDLAVIAYCVAKFGLPAGLKLSVHSGSDKFSLYGPISRALRARGAGLHLKTAGTTWLEELIGLSVAGDAGLAIARKVYNAAIARREELCAPYSDVVDIDPAGLPPAEEVAAWPGEVFAAAVRHEPGNPGFNSSVRQLLHVGYKVAAEMGDEYLDALEANSEVIARNVTANILERHLMPLFAC